MDFSLYRFQRWLHERADLLALAAFLIALARRFPLFTPLAAYAVVGALAAEVKPERTFTYSPDFDTWPAGDGPLGRNFAWDNPDAFTTGTMTTDTDPTIRYDPRAGVFVVGSETMSPETFLERYAAPIKRDTAPQPPTPLGPLAYDDGHIRPFSEALGTLRMAAASKNMTSTPLCDDPTIDCTIAEGRRKRMRAANA